MAANQCCYELSEGRCEQPVREDSFYCSEEHEQAADRAFSLNDEHYRVLHRIEEERQTGSMFRSVARLLEIEAACMRIPAMQVSEDIAKAFENFSFELIKLAPRFELEV